jgi:hypothetical protein
MTIVFSLSFRLAGPPRRLARMLHAGPQTNRKWQQPFPPA